MAEKLVSPGVFTRENDLSFIAQGVGAIGGAIVGPFKQGPAFKPTIVTSPSELEDIFGAADGTYYTELYNLIHNNNKNCKRKKKTSRKHTKKQRRGKR